MMNSPIYYRINKQIRKTNRMTYALAVKCADGVMLAADTKFTVNGGSDYVYGHKITGEIRGVLTAFAGNREPFEDFRTHLREYAVEMDEKDKRIRLEQLSIRIKDIMRMLDNHYGTFFKFDVLAGVSTTEGAKLRYFYQDGRPEIVDKYKAIGTGSPHGLVYLKTHWHKNITMDQAADLAYFIIRYIEKFRLDLTVGTGDEHPSPLVRLIPNIPYQDGRLDGEPTEDEYERYEFNASRRLEKIQNSIINDYKI